MRMKLERFVRMSKNYGGTAKAAMSMTAAKHGKNRKMKKEKVKEKVEEEK